MYPTLLVFASLVAAIASVGSQDTSSTGSPVDAWRTVTLPGAFYLIYRSYENDEGLGGTGKCVSIELSEKNEETKTTKSGMKYWDDQKNSWIIKTVRIKVAPTGGDTIQMSNAEGGDASASEGRFVYSDYGTCDVVVLSGTGDKKCELWVSAAVAPGGDTSGSQKLDKCLEEYENQCSGQEKYQIYDTAPCSSE
ncbi:uncharacterized protein LOC115320985 [Ixodes scapularis]|uniref:uncharacterized protein LOC115320985 n=1 Tax=Ixodes scapularis TaxID=6945 RepID=UPI001A9FE76D|nr:uncharacterized protein LOC115320985 [Ixodes scapularis]